MISRPLARIDLFFDGGTGEITLGHGGWGAYFIIHCKKFGAIKQKHCGPLGLVSNNTSEYLALIRGLSALLHHLQDRLSQDTRLFDLRVNGDSELIIRQLNGQYSVKANHLKPLFNMTKRLLQNFRVVKFRSISRQFNKQADNLAQFGSLMKGFTYPSHLRFQPMYTVTVKIDGVQVVASHDAGITMSDISYIDSNFLMDLPNGANYIEQIKDCAPFQVIVSKINMTAVAKVEIPIKLILADGSEHSCGYTQLLIVDTLPVPIHINFHDNMIPNTSFNVVLANESKVPINEDQIDISFRSHPFWEEI